jgi:hypothetical protein
MGEKTVAIASQASPATNGISVLEPGDTPIIINQYIELSARFSDVDHTSA